MITERDGELRICQLQERSESVSYNDEELTEFTECVNAKLTALKREIFNPVSHYIFHSTGRLQEVYTCCLRTHYF